jgi:carbon storage regulator
MLVLSRKKNETIDLSGGIKITVVRIGKDRVRIGIDAPANIEVLRDDAKTRQPQHKIPGAAVAPEYRTKDR